MKSEDILQDIACGKKNEKISTQMRSLLFNTKVPLKTLQSYSFVTTSKGRNYQKVQIDR